MVKITDAKKFLLKETLFEDINKELGTQITGEENTRKTIFLSACGCWVDGRNPTSHNLLVNSNSGAGKDFVVKKTLAVFPKNVVVMRTRISPTALNYMHANDEDFSWDGKIFYVSDVSENLLNCDSLKVMMSEGSQVTIVIKGKAKDLIVNGKPVCICTTATAIPSEEIARRFPICPLDETQDQTTKILERQAEFAETGQKQVYDETILTALTLLNRVRVKIPFARKIVAVMPKDHIIMRTHFLRFLDYIKASCALHQFQRQKEDGFHIADPKDYDIARVAMQQTTTNRLMIPLTKKEKMLLDVCAKQPEWFSVPDIEKEVTFLSEKSIYTYLDKLRENFLDCDKLPRDKSDKLVKFYHYRTQQELTIPTYAELEEQYKQLEEAKK